MQQKYKAFLDMDGVLFDFMAAIAKIHGRPIPYDTPRAMGVWDIEKLWGITPEEFWAPVALKSLEFWSNVPKTPEADQIVKYVTEEFGNENVAILTSPSMDAGCIPGKRYCIQKYFPQFKDRIIFGSAKEFLAGPGRVLIDDRDRNVDDFVAAGGYGIIIPRPWNRDHAFTPAVVEILQRELSKWRRHGTDPAFR